jgi:hypothetical protein
VKLNDELKQQLCSKISSSVAAGDNFLSLVDDACELLTLQFVLLIKKRVRAIREQMEAHSKGSAKRNDLAQQVNALKRLMVEVSET